MAMLMWMILFVVMLTSHENCGVIGAVQYVDYVEILNESLNDFVFLSESSARANLIRIASGRNT